MTKTLSLGKTEGMPLTIVPLRTMMLNAKGKHHEFDSDDSCHLYQENGKLLLFILAYFMQLPVFNKFFFKKTIEKITSLSNS